MKDNTQFVYQLILYTLDYAPLMIIPYSQLTYTANFNEYDSLSFTIIKDMWDIDKSKTVENPAWDELVFGKIVKLQIFNYESGSTLTDPIKEEYFIIQQPQEQVAEGNVTRQYSCVPLHQSLFNKLELRGMDSTRVLFDMIDKEPNEEGMIVDPQQRAYKIETDLAYYKDNDSDEYHTYDPIVYTQGGVMNYILEYILNGQMLPVIDTANPIFEYDASIDADTYWKIKEIDPVVQQNLDGTILDSEEIDKIINGIQGEVIPEETAGQKEQEKLTDTVKYGVKPYFKQSIFNTLDSTLKGSFKNFRRSFQELITSGDPFLSESSNTGRFINGLEQEFYNAVYAWEDWYASYQKYLLNPMIKGGQAGADPGTHEEYQKEFMRGQLQRSTDNGTVVSTTTYLDEEIAKGIIMNDGYSLISKQDDTEYYYKKDTSVPAEEGQNCVFTMEYIWEWVEVPDEPITVKSDDRPYYSVDNIVSHPFGGVLFLNDLEQLLLETQNLVRNINDIHWFAGIMYEDTSNMSSNSEEKLIIRESSERREALQIALGNFFEQASYFMSHLLYGLITPMYVFRTKGVSEKFRTVNFSNTNLTEVFNQLAESFSCVFQFDNVHKDIYIYDRNNSRINTDNPLILSGDNVIMTISRQVSTDQMISRLYLKGKEDIGIGGYNINGLEYIDDFSYFIDKGLMQTEDLIAKLEFNQKVKEDARIFQDWVDSHSWGESEQSAMLASFEDVYSMLNYKDKYDTVLERNGKEINSLNRLEYLFTKYTILLLQFYVKEENNEEVYDIKPFTQNPLFKGVTIKFIQDRIVELEKQLTAMEGLAQGWFDAEFSKDACSGYSSYFYEDNAEAAALSEQGRIEEETKFYCWSNFTEPESGTLNYLNFYRRIYDSDYGKPRESNYEAASSYKKLIQGLSENDDERDIPEGITGLNNAIIEMNDNSLSFYIRENLTLLYAALIKWQKRFQYPNLKHFEEDRIIEKDGFDYTKYGCTYYINEQNNSNIFTGADLSLLNNYVFEGDQQMNDITDAKTLYLYGVDYLKYLTQEPISLSISSLDLFSGISKLKNWEMLEKAIHGGYIYIHLPELNINYSNEFRVQSYQHQVQNGSSSLNITLSNSYELKNDYNKLIRDTWANAYKQIQDINSYRHTWEEYQMKQEALLEQGEAIRADVNTIVSSHGRAIVTNNGLKVSNVSNNALTYGPNGYYVPKTTYTYTNGDVTKSAAATPNKIKFDSTAQEAKIENGIFTIPIGEGGGGGGGSADPGDINSVGFPLNFASPYISTRLKALLPSSKPIYDSAAGKWYVNYIDSYSSGVNNEEYPSVKVTCAELDSNNITSSPPSGTLYSITHNFFDGATVYVTVATKKGEEPEGTRDGTSEAKAFIITNVYRQVEYEQPGTDQKDIYYMKLEQLVDEDSPAIEATNARALYWGKPKETDSNKNMYRLMTYSSIKTETISVNNVWFEYDLKVYGYKLASVSSYNPYIDIKFETKNDVYFPTIYLGRGTSTNSSEGRVKIQKESHGVVVTYNTQGNDGSTDYDLKEKESNHDSSSDSRPRSLAITNSGLWQQRGENNWQKIPYIFTTDSISTTTDYADAEEGDWIVVSSAYSDNNNS